MDQLTDHNIKEVKPQGKEVLSIGLSNTIKDILEDEGLDIEEQFTSLVWTKYPGAGDRFYEKEGIGIVKRYSESEYIFLEDKGNSIIEISMLQVPGRGEEAMLDVLCFCIKEGYTKITGKIQPQKRPSPRRDKILLDKWISFGFTSKDRYNLELELSEKNIEVLRNKVTYYLKNEKWFHS